MSRRQQSVLTVLLVLLLSGFGVMLPASGPARAADGTMTFTGVLDVVGLLSSITVQPGAVTVPAGGEVSFVNGTSAALTVDVGGKSARLDPGGSTSMLFTGADRAETFPVSATSVSLPVVGALTSSSGRVTVLAIPAASVRSGESPASPGGQRGMGPRAPGPAGSREQGGSRPASPEPGSEAGATPDAERDGTAPGELPGDGGTEPETRSGAVIPLDASPGPAETSSPAPTGPGGGDGTESSGSGNGNPGDRGGDYDGARDGGRAAHEARRVDAEVEPVLPPFPGFSSKHDQLGLVFLLGAVVLAGVGAALIRTVLALRPVVEVGAHSQAARKARKARRRRG